MTPASDLFVLRRAYAKHVAYRAGTEDPRIIDALASIHREDYVPPGPWQLSTHGFICKPTPDNDPLYLYQDVTVPILPNKGLNNGQPSFVIGLIGLCDPREGDRIIHIGVGSGYYTALLAILAGPTGRVHGLEIEPDLAHWASERLAHFTNTAIMKADGFTAALEEADVVLVNAGTPRFSATWLDALAPGGRLIVPLAVGYEDDMKHMMTKGAVVRVIRDDVGFAASVHGGVGIYPCAGAGDPGADRALSAALERGGAAKVTRLVRGAPPADAWLSGDGWALTSD